MQQQADEEELGLSSAALAALKEFALENNMLGPEGGDVDMEDVRLQVQERMDIKERAHDFRFTFGDDGDDDQVCISLTGVNPELGQTLASTGLTVWRAAQEMARFMWEHREWFVGKRVVELGAGLGLCGVLASKVCTGGTVVITDGGEEFTDSAMDALRKNLEKNSCNLMAAASPARDRDGVPAAAPAAAPGEGAGARVALERLTWGEHTDFLDRYGGGNSAAGDSEGKGTGGGEAAGFDFVIAADVIYEEEGVSPLLHTVVDILRLRRGTNEQEREPAEEAQQDRQKPSPVPQLGAAAAFTPPTPGANPEQALVLEMQAQTLTMQAQLAAMAETVETAAGACTPPTPGANRQQQQVLEMQAAALTMQSQIASMTEAAPAIPQQHAPGVLPTEPGPAGSGGHPSSVFLLAFARRNISIERVLKEAESLGLTWKVPEDFEPTSASENIYLMSLR